MTHPHTEALHHAGSILSNIAFNLAQKIGDRLTSDDVAILDKARKAWDVANNAAHPTAWRDIASAPKDGTPIILTNGTDVSQGNWLHEEPYIREKRDADGRYIDQDESDGYDGWVDWMGGMQPDPTHWMPLPPPPDRHPAEQQEGGDAKRLAELVLSAIKNRSDKDWTLMHLDLSEAAELATAMTKGVDASEGDGRA